MATAFRKHPREIGATITLDDGTAIHTGEGYEPSHVIKPDGTHEEVDAMDIDHPLNSKLMELDEKGYDSVGTMRTAEIKEWEKARGALEGSSL